MPVKWTHLENTWKKMGLNEAREYTVNFGDKKGNYDLENIFKELKQGKEIKGIEAENLPEISGLLSYEGVHVLLYINRPYKKKEALEKVPCLDGPRFHMVQNCSKLQEMYHKKKSDRYIIITEPDGIFDIHPYDDEGHENRWRKEPKWLEDPIKIKLLPCHPCLEALNYQSYNSKTIDQKRDFRFNIFDLKDFTDFYEPFFIDTRFYRKKNNDNNFNYSKDHPLIRKDLMQDKDYKCDKCKVQINEKKYQKYLHMHHIKKQRGDNRISNLQLLCVVCRCTEPGHDDLRKLVDADAFSIIDKLRREQGLT